MANRKPRNPTPAPGRRTPATPDAAAAPAVPTPPMAVEDDGTCTGAALVPAYDPANFDPGEFEWRPVPRRPRADGWTPDVQRAFMQALADTGLVEHAARAVDMSVASAYRLRRAPGSESFAHAWVTALASAAERALDVAFARAIEGQEEPVFDRDGRRIGSRRRTSDRLMMFILRAYMPDRFRHAHLDAIQPGEILAPAPTPLAEAVVALTPPVPDAPHMLAPPDEMAAMVEGARGRALVDRLYPRDDRETYRPPFREPDHPAALHRAAQRSVRDRRREARENELYGTVDGVYVDPDPEKEDRPESFYP